jgi:hypothetical protein
MITAQQAREMMPNKKQDIYNTLEARIKEAIEYGSNHILVTEVITDDVINKMSSLGFTVVRSLYSNYIVISWE